MKTNKLNFNASNFTHPKWLENAIFYEIYPQSFKDSNNDGIGDINGIISKLDYIESIGFNAIWLNPIFDSPFFDAGYDVTDYYKIASRYGTLEDFKKLLKEAHKKNIKIVLDLVPGHTSIESKWFKDSCKAENNEFSNRYIWTKSVWETPKDLNYIRGFSQRDGSVVTNFFSIQPALNYGFYKKENDYEETLFDEGPQSTIKAIIEVIKYWFDLGVDGFRVDMAGWLSKRDIDSIGTMQIWNEIFKIVKPLYPQKAFISEWSNPTKALNCGFDCDFILQDSFAKYHTDLTRGKNPYFSVKSKNGDASGFLNYYMNMYQELNKYGCSISLISGNHDTIRIKETLTNDEELKMYYAFLYTFPGVPFMYYGDEIGMNYLHNLNSVEGGYQRTGSRSPMQWDNTKYAGFCGKLENNSKLYIPIDKNKNRPNVLQQSIDKNSLLNFVKTLIQIRKNNKELWSFSDLEYIYVNEKDYPIVYLRKTKEGQILVIINASSRKKQYTCHRLYKGKVLLNYNKVKIVGNNITLPAQSIYILKVN